MEKVPKINVIESEADVLQVVALVYDKLCMFEYGIAAEVFGLSRPELSRELYGFTSVALENGPLSTTGGLSFNATGTINNLRSAHTIVIPGWRGIDAPVPTQMCIELQDAYQRGARLLSICSGGYVLAAAGLLDHKTVTTHWQYAEDFKSRYPKVVVQESALYIEQDNIITSAGSSAGIDACLHLVKHDYGTKIANTVARRLVMHAHRQGNQAQVIAQPVPKSAEGQRLSLVMDDVRKSLSMPHSLTSMAKLADMSPRTFQRQFTSLTGVPAKHWVTQERISRSCQLLETTDLPMDRIVQEVGFTTAESMRYHFRQKMQMSPQEYRKRFRQTK